MTRIGSPSSLPLKEIWLEPRSKEGSPTFRPHDILEGEVLEKIDARQILIRLEGRSYVAESRIPLSEGDRMLLRVEATHPRVVLTPLLKGSDQDPGIPLSLKTLSSLFLPESQTVSLSGLQRMGSQVFPGEIRETVEKLLGLLNQFAVEDPARLNSDEVRKSVVRSGLLFEEKIGRMVETGTGDPWEKMVKEDLKGLLMTLREELERGNPSSFLPKEEMPSLEKTGDSLNQILNKIEGTQVLNLLPLEDRQRIFLLLPLWFQEHLYFADVQISLPRFRKDPSEPEDVAVLFLLDMPDWGRLSLEARMKGENLYGLFKVSDPGVASFLEENLPGLKERLGGMGFTPQLNVSVETPERIIPEPSFRNRSGQFPLEHCHITREFPNADMRNHSDVSIL